MIEILFFGFFLGNNRWRKNNTHPCPCSALSWSLPVIHLEPQRMPALHRPCKSLRLPFFYFLSSTLEFFFFFLFLHWYPEMPNAVSNLMAALNTYKLDKGIYLYAPVSKLGSSAQHLMALLAPMGVGLPNSPLCFHPSSHALRIHGPVEALRSFQTEIPSLRISDSTLVRFNWSCPTPPDTLLVAKAPTFRLRIDGIEDTISKAYWESTLHAPHQHLRWPTTPPLSRQSPCARAEHPLPRTAGNSDESTATQTDNSLLLLPPPPPPSSLANLPPSPSFSAPPLSLSPPMSPNRGGPDEDVMGISTSAPKEGPQIVSPPSLAVSTTLD